MPCTIGRRFVVKIALHEEAKKGKGYYSLYSDWEADTSAKRPETSGDWTFSGKRTLKGWRFTYRNGCLASIEAPSSFDYFGRLAEKCEDGVTISYAYDAYPVEDPAKR